MDMDLIIHLLSTLLLTIICYMAYPMLRLLIHNQKFEKRQARRIALWNSIVLGLAFCIITSITSDARWNPGPALLYYWINEAILTKKEE